MGRTAKPSAPPKPKTPPRRMLFSNRDRWEMLVKENKDEFGVALTCFAEHWAILMEDEITKRKDATQRIIAECAIGIARNASNNGITGYMLDRAVAMLHKTWLHGQGLRKWHNGRFGQDGEDAEARGDVFLASSVDGN